MKVALISLAITMLGTLASDEIKQWLPWLAIWLKDRAVRRLPLRHHARYDEEWAAGLEEVPGNISKVLYALSLLRGASRINLLYADRRRASDQIARSVLRILNILGAIVAIAAMLPLLFITALMVRLESSGPIFFRQKRIGRDGHEFDLYKFRTTMNCRPGARVTPLGTLLRCFRLDELPQFWNVMRGDMVLPGLVRKSDD